ncbi:MAG: hypothetical protein WC761_02585 [Candidatus Paceibacterota bacterium]|jgi:hypothetical protein
MKPMRRMIKSRHMNKVLAVFMLAVLFLGIVIGGRYIHDQQKAEEKNIEERAETYVKVHISELAPEKEVLGGRFFVIKTAANLSEDRSVVRGEVEYEDGHNSYVAVYVFKVNTNKSLTLQSFELAN